MQLQPTNSPRLVQRMTLVQHPNAKYEVKLNVPPPHHRSHPQAHGSMLLLDDYDIDALATDLVMRREDLKRRLHDPYALSGLRVPQLKRILCHVRRKQGRTAVSPMRPHVCVCGPARLRANACE